MSTSSRLVGIGCLVAAFYTGHRSYEFRRHGEVVTGTVVAVDVETRVGAGGLDRSERPQIRYTPKSGGPPLVLTGDWSNALFGEYRPGESITVRYLPDDPSDARTDSRARDLLVPLLLLVIGIVGVRGQLRSDGSDDDNHWFVWRDRRE